ncbi:MAG: hypothetical protein GX605_02730 [Chloroflexi bacterium]|nr:hypothetical protein [Chloroflexota bacterium]
MSLGSLDEHRRMYPLGEGIRLARYTYTSPGVEKLQVTLVDQISGFPQRAEGHAEVVAAVGQMLATMRFLP